MHPHPSLRATPLLQLPVPLCQGHIAGYSRRGHRVAWGATVVLVASSPLLGTYMGRTGATNSRSRKSVGCTERGQSGPQGHFQAKVQMDRNLDEAKKAGEGRRARQCRKVPWGPPRCESAWKRIPRVASIVPAQILP